MDPILHWNEAALEANRVAHTTGDARDRASTGPAGSSRAMAITHLAMHDAWFGINPDPADPMWLTTPPVPEPGASAEAAVAAAAHATLAALYPSQTAYLDAHHTRADLGSGSVTDGHAFGLAVAAAVLAARADDPATVADGHASSVAPGAHRTAPDDVQQSFHAPHYGARSRCFAVPVRHTLARPPQIGSLAYNDALVQVRGKGIAPELMGTLPPGAPRRTATETLVGIFWGYDGAKGLGTPPRLYNQIVRKVAEAQGNDVARNARLFARVNAAMGDAGILAWDEKYRHDFWRPVVGIREHDPSLGAAAVAGATLDDDCDPGWLPLGAPRTNEPGRANFTPPFPAYPSGHATFGAAALDVVRREYGYTSPGPDPLLAGVPIVSDEYDGTSTDNKGAVRPRHTRAFAGGLWDMILENSLSRVYLGVHWSFDGFTVDGTGAYDPTSNMGGVPLGLAIAADVTAGLSQAAAADRRL